MNMKDFFNWTRKVQTNNPETSDTIRGVVSKQYGNVEPTTTPQEINPIVSDTTDEKVKSED